MYTCDADMKVMSARPCSIHVHVGYMYVHVAVAAFTWGCGKLMRSHFFYRSFDHGHSVNCTAPDICFDPFAYVPSFMYECTVHPFTHILMNSTLLSLSAFCVHVLKHIPHSAKRY